MATNLIIPNLDDRRWIDLVEEARALIPLHAPTWPGHHPSHRLAGAGNPRHPGASRRSRRQRRGHRPHRRRGDGRGAVRLILSPPPNEP